MFQIFIYDPFETLRPIWYFTTNNGISLQTSILHIEKVRCINMVLKCHTVPNRSRIGRRYFQPVLTTRFTYQHQNINECKANFRWFCRSVGCYMTNLALCNRFRLFPLEERLNVKKQLLEGCVSYFMNVNTCISAIALAVSICSTLTQLLSC